MRSATTKFELIQPRSLEDALTAMRENKLVPIAGCTDVYVQLEFNQAPGSRYINIWGIDELRGISVNGDVLRLGALTTYTEMIESDVVRDWLPMMIDAARQVGGVQIQTRGTIGGNIANGSPAGDSLPVFAVADAVVVTTSRRIPFDQFYTGYRASVLKSDELIVAVEVPRVKGKQWFRKVGTRAAQAISKIVVAAVRSDKPRVAFGSVGPTVMRVPRTEAALASGNIDEARRILMDEITPIDDLRSTAGYRMKVATNLLARFWDDTSS